MRLPFLSRSVPTVSVVRMSGVIASGTRGRLSDQAMAPVLERAFRKGRTAAVALLLNSPGGSPVQSSLIGARIRRLSEERNIPVFAFVEDVAASGGYWLAVAADSIWLDACSIVGSIGVISSGFGFQDFIEHHGIERRVHTAGNNKSFLDPFRPEKPEDVERLLTLQEQMHSAFVAHVQGRRPALTDPDLFTGEFWVGEKAISLGLADGLAHMVPKMKELYGDKTRFRGFGPRRGLLSRFGVEAAGAMFDAVEDRAAYARFGL